jgi:hypothetical protein
MSRNYGAYSQYLGAQRCCDLRGQGPQGIQGPTGPAAIGPIGNTGPAGMGFTGPTGRSCRGPTGEPGPTGSKTFIIDHPINANKHLVHVCLEGPEAGVYYRGKGEIKNEKWAEIELPKYVDMLAYDFTVQITPIYSGEIVTLNASEVENGRFYVYGKNTKFHWTVYGKRYDIEVEPDKGSVEIKGNGPYLYI